MSNPNTSGRLIRGEWWATGAGQGAGTVTIETARDPAAQLVTTDSDVIVVDTIHIVGDASLTGFLELTNGTNVSTVITLVNSMNVTLTNIAAFERPDATNGDFDLQLRVTAGNVLNYWIGGYHGE